MCLYVCAWGYVWVPHVQEPKEVRRGPWIPWNCSYRSVSCYVVVESKLRLSVLNYWLVSIGLTHWSDSCPHELVTFPNLQSSASEFQRLSLQQALGCRHISWLWLVGLCLPAQSATWLHGHWDVAVNLTECRVTGEMGPWACVEGYLDWVINGRRLILLWGRSIPSVEVPGL